MRIAFVSGEITASRASGLFKIRDIFEDRIESWTGYPLTSTAVVHRPTRYLEERCRLIEIFENMHDVVLTSDKQRTLAIREFSSEVNRVSERMQTWYEQLPFELQYRWPMSVAVLELQFVHLLTVLDP
jgi:hypothetical protein